MSISPRYILRAALYVLFLNTPLSPTIANDVVLQYLSATSQSLTEIGSSVSPPLAGLLQRSSSFEPVVGASVVVSMSVDNIGKDIRSCASLWCTPTPFLQRSSLGS